MMVEHVPLADKRALHGVEQRHRQRDQRREQTAGLRVLRQVVDVAENVVQLQRRGRALEAREILIADASARGSEGEGCLLLLLLVALSKHPDHHVHLPRPALVSFESAAPSRRVCCHTHPCPSPSLHTLRPTPLLRKRLRQSSVGMRGLGAREQQREEQSKAGKSREMARADSSATCNHARYKRGTQRACTRLSG
eukprot:3285033-Rhodomonas_salina.1